MRTILLTLAAATITLAAALPATAQSWYGFGGAWGGVSDGAEPGPLGPSHWKLPADPDPGDSGAP